MCWLRLCGVAPAFASNARLDGTLSFSLVANDELVRLGNKLDSIRLWQQRLEEGLHVEDELQFGDVRDRTTKGLSPSLRHLIDCHCVMNVEVAGKNTKQLIDCFVRMTVADAEDSC